MGRCPRLRGLKLAREHMLLPIAVNKCVHQCPMSLQCSRCAYRARHRFAHSSTAFSFPRTTQPATKWMLSGRCRPTGGRSGRREPAGLPPMDCPGRSPWTWDQRFEDSIQEPRREKGMTTICEGERADLFEMVRPMLAFRPEQRPSAQQVLRSSWMRNWAAPAGEVGRI